VHTKYLLIGGGLAAGQAAKELRQNDPGARITLVGDEPYVPYDRPPLSKEFLRGEKRREELFFDPEEYYRNQNISVLLGVAVQGLNRATKSATLNNGETVTFEKALIATGGRPVPLPIPGVHLGGVHYLRTLDDSTAISAAAVEGRHAVMIGAGFIGMEVAASLTQRGLHVTVIEAQDRIWSRFADARLAKAFQSYCEKKGITFLIKERAAEIRGDPRVSVVLTVSGKELPCDLVCIGAGILPNAEIAEAAGLEVNNGVLVNEYLQSSHPDIYAAGDVANYWDPLFQKRRRVEHWGHAEYCGQLAGQNMAGARNPYDLLTYVWSDIFDLHLEFAGDESECDQVLLRGSLEEKSFMVLYLKQRRLTAYFAVNPSSKDLPVLQRLIRQKTDLSGKEPRLQDPAIALKSL
jgi:NADPH-dependent 2,4-dienoyl-CoA reductase/sulfur reductase-like enzyme